MVQSAQVFEVEDIRVLEVISNPMRLRMLRYLVEPTTVRSLADLLQMPVTRLYYHVNLLEEVGVIKVVETRKSGARLERFYQAVASRFQPGPGLLTKGADKGRIAEVAAGAVLDGARLDAVAGLLAHFEGPAEPAGTLGRSVAPMSQATAEEFSRRLGELVDEMSAIEDQDGEEYAFSFVFFPMVGPMRGEI